LWSCRKLIVFAFGFRLRCIICCRVTFGCFAIGYYIINLSNRFFRYSFDFINDDFFDFINDDFFNFINDDLFNFINDGIFSI
jgi:hypothetical protein